MGEEPAGTDKLAAKGSPVLLTTGEVASLLRLNHQVVQRMLRCGDLPGYRVGRTWRVEQSELLAWLAAPSNQPPG